MMNDPRWYEEQVKWNNVEINPKNDFNSYHKPTDSKLSFDPRKWEELNQRNYDVEFQDTI